MISPTYDSPSRFENEPTLTIPFQLNIGGSNQDELTSIGHKRNDGDGME
jgi:hypothetical protein